MLFDSLFTMKGTKVTNTIPPSQCAKFIYETYSEVAELCVCVKSLKRSHVA